MTSAKKSKVLTPPNNHPMLTNPLYCNGLTYITPSPPPLPYLQKLMLRNISSKH